MRFSVRHLDKTVKHLLSQKVNNFRNMTTTNKYIATHDGLFHCDEVTACFMLKQLPLFKNHDIVRSRQKDVLDSADIVADVGEVFDAATRRFDHHQVSFNLTIRDFHPHIKSTNPIRPIRLSSAGLIYAHYGKDFIKEILQVTTKGNHNGEEYDDNCKRTQENMDSKDMLESIYQKLYGSFIEEIDAIDNGIELVEGDDIVYNYNISSNLSSRIARLNPGEKDASAEDRLKQFHLAMSVVGKELTERVQHLHSKWWPSLERLKECILNRHDVDESGAILEIPLSDSISCGSSILLLEERLSIVGQIKYFIYQSVQSSPPWRISCVHIRPNSFITRLPLKKEWRGIKKDELRKISGVSDAEFVHVAGFTGGAMSRDGCLAMARKTIQAASEQ